MFGHGRCCKDAGRGETNRRRIAAVKAISRRSLVAFLTFLLAFGTTPAQLWATGAEGLAQAAEDVAAAAAGAADANAPSAQGGAEDESRNDDDAVEQSPSGSNQPAAVEDAAAQTEATAPSKGTGGAEETEEPKSAQTQELATDSDAGQDKDDSAVAAADAGSDRVSAKSAAEQPAERAATVTASAQIIGVDAEGQPESWATASGIELPEGSTAADLFAALVKKAGLTADYKLFDDGYFRLDSITSPNDGRVLSYDMTTDANWMLYVDGSAAWNTEAETAVANGSTVTWYYTIYGASLPDLGPSEPDQPEDKTVTASAQVIGIDAEGNPEAWASAPSIELPEGSTAADLFLALKDQTGLTAGYRQEDDGYFSLDNVTSPNDGRTLAYDDDTMAFWQFFYNGTSSNSMEYQTVLKTGDAVVWYYSVWGASLPDLGPSEPDQPEDKVVTASAQVIGIDAEGQPESWATASIELPEGSTAADLFKALVEKTGIIASYLLDDDGYFRLDSITSPNDGHTLEYDWVTDANWMLYVDGSVASGSEADTDVTDGTAITWYYTTYGEPLPDLSPSKPDQPEDGVVVNPDAPRPDWESSWPGFATANKPTDAQTPTADAEGKWTLDLGGRGSDPIYVGSYVYVASGNKLLQIDAATGKAAKSGVLQTSIDSTARMVYAGGVIVVPLHGGRLQALTADTLTTVWVTDELASDQQSLGTLTVRDGYVYAGTSNDSGSAGYLTCVSLADGSIRWSQKAESGFYWAGSVAMGDYLVTGNDKGEVYAYDPATGKTAGTPLALDSSIRMTLVSDGTYIYAISSKGVLYQLSVSEDGEVSVAKQVQFGKKSTSTPAIVNGKLVFGGTASSWKTALFVYDAATLTLEHEVTMLTDGSELPRGSSQSAPLVSVQDGAAYAYFTVNNTPGGVYRYKLGDSAAELIYAPVEGQQNYCMNSVIAGPDGTLYYVNDSGTLFAVGAVGGAVDPKPDPDPEPKPDPDPEPAKTAALTVSNTVKGSQSAQQQAFSYTVELRGGGAADVTGTYGDLDFKAGVAAFTLTGGQSKKATDLPAGLSYIVTQVPVDGFASNQTVFEGVLKADGSFTAAFENTQDEVPATVTASASIVGVDGDGKQQTWAPEASFDLAEGATAADLTEALFRQAGITADYDPDTAYGWYLKSITSPSDPALTLGYDYETGDYWQFFVNGEMASVGASSYVLQPGDTISWVYGHDGLMPGQISASIEIIGQDANGLVQRWAAPATIKLTEGATAADLSEALFRQAGITADYGEGTWGWYLNTITSPFDGDLTLGTEDMGGGRWAYWRLFVNGEPSQLGAGGVELKKGDAVSWVYTAEDEMPDAGDIQVDPTAPRPDYEASHPGFAQSPTGGNVVKAPTPTTGTTLNWTYALGAEGGKASSGSDPLIVNGDLYVVSGSMLRVLDRATGTVKQDASGRKLEVSIGANMGYFCRPVYTDGLIIVPREDGSLVAFTADALTCVWQSAAPDLPSSLAGKDYCYQALSSLMVNGGYVYAGFTVDGNKGAAGDGGFAGALVCVDIDTGRVVWSRVTDSAQTGAAAGYYWAGAAPSGDDIVIGDESGSVQLIDGATGAVLSTVEGLGGAIRAGVVAIPGQDGTFLAVSRDNGTLYKLVRTGNALAVAGKVAFAAESTSTPAVADGQAFVCGVDAEGYGTLSIIDLASMRVVKTVRGGQGKAQSAPLVSQTANGTYVYFTCNGRPGGVYSYRVGDTSAVQIYEPDAAHQQYTTSSVIADEQGNLYYTNDSGTLFSLKGALSWKVTYDTLGGSPVRPSYVVRGGVLSRPADPTRAGYTFKGWYTDKACTETWDFEAAVTGDMTLYAKWEETADSDNGQEPGGNGGHDGNGGQHGSGDSNQNASSDANGSEDGGDGKAPVPAGTVAPGEAPLSQAESEALESQDDAESDQADGDDSEAADDATGQEHGSASAGDTLSSSSERAQAHQAAATFGLPLAALIAGLVGAIGLIAAIILFLMGKRGKGSHA